MLIQTKVIDFLNLRTFYREYAPISSRARQLMKYKLKNKMQREMIKKGELIKF